MKKLITTLSVFALALCLHAQKAPAPIRLADVELKLSDRIVQKEVKFPALKKLNGYVPVLKARIFFKAPHAGGWTPCGIIRLNGKVFTPKTAAKQSRLLRRGLHLESSVKGKVRKSPYFAGGKVLVMYGNGKENGLDRRIISDKREGFRYYFDISDLAKYGSGENTLLLGTNLTEKALGGKNYPINFRDMQILYVKEAEVNSLRK